MAYRAAFAGLMISAAVSAAAVEAQTRRRGTAVPGRSAAAKEAVPTPQQTPAPAKRNERPHNGTPAEKPAERPEKADPSASGYSYEFSQPAFNVGYVRIEHDDKGKGSISFKKKGSDELISDPIVVSAATLRRIDEALEQLDFLNSEENYQYEKDFSHLGNITFSLKRGGRSRAVKFNWTEVKAAKALMDEYRKIGNQYIWVFDITLSRENQPLDAPRLFDSLDSLIRRNEISDPYQLEPFLRELANDERIPLIARNHSTRLLKQFEKQREKEKKN